MTELMALEIVSHLAAIATAVVAVAAYAMYLHDPQGKAIASRKAPPRGEGDGHG